ncbi:DgyrCDS13749 [Dimorphilus gyrociliatus]|uniref:DgyrCDS13749 n=1 Tax=Dimorphilus gyrociliatus TaxID=2664684 RepID=A0A7I8WBM9_9ANNE|nr:DgyrCDS13749 [Dimorphilus gyrociliatus]
MESKKERDLSIGLVAYFYDPSSFSKLFNYFNVSNDYETCNGTDTTIEIRDVSYENLKELLKIKDETVPYLIDVRNRSEIVETYLLPKAVNVPLHELNEAFRLPKDKFQEKYGKYKAEKSHSNLIIYCRSGARAVEGYRCLYSMGYINIKRYKGSYLEWNERLEQ